MSTLARLRSLVAVADTGSVREASRRLTVTESAVSAALAALAREVKAPLVEREGRGLRLTESGRAYADYARRILGLHEEALAAARAGHDPGHGRVRVAAVPSAGEYLLPRILASFLDAHPDVDLRLEVGTSERVWAMFGAHEADLVIGGRPPAHVADAVSAATCANLLVVVAAPALAEQITAMSGGAGLESARWLQREAGSATRAHGEALLSALEVDPSRLTLGSSGAVIAGAVAGLGATLAPRDAVRRHLRAGELAEIKVPGTPLRRPWRAVTHDRPPPAAALFVRHLVAAEGWKPAAPKAAAAVGA
ncbi:MAG: LysR substrate-binding domain-containing protein [Streptosporangiales bacterium]|nr:LysR substrate-binding domain-containing protein [Streptosporangiales bacterium]